MICLLPGLLKREREIMGLLKEIAKRKGFVVIGGYAVNAFTQPRFSLDLDIVVDKKDSAFFRKFLEGRGFLKVAEFRELPYKGTFERFEKKLETGNISVDLLIGEVASRQTDASYSYEYLKKYSRVRNITGIAERVRARVADAELLIALKINSARNVDIRDVFMLAGTKVQLEVIKKHLEKVNKKKLRENLEKIKSAINEKQFRDSLQGCFGMVDNKTFERNRKKLIKILNALLT